MEKKCCMTCKYGAYKLISRLNPGESFIYCIKWTKSTKLEGYCEEYQKDSRHEEE